MKALTTAAVLSLMVSGGIAMAQGSEATAPPVVAPAATSAQTSAAAPVAPSKEMKDAKTVAKTGGKKSRKHTK